MPKILIIEDASVERELIIQILKSEGIQVDFLEAASGEEAIDILGKNYKDVRLILLDWQMPQMDGLEFMQGVVKVPAVSQIPIVMVTASGTLEDQAKAQQANPNLAGYISKPYEPEELIKTVQSFL